MTSWNGSLYYGGRLRTTVDDCYQPYVGRIPPNLGIPEQILFAPGEIPQKTVVLSIVPFETIDESPNAYLWCSLNEFGGTPGEGPPPCLTFAVSPVYRLNLNDDNRFHREPLPPHAEPLVSFIPGYLVKDTTTSPHSLVFGFADFGGDPWDFTGTACSNEDHPAHTVLRRQPTGGVNWSDAAPTTLQGITHALHVGPAPNNAQALYIAGNRFDLDPDPADCAGTNYIDAGPFRIAAGDWEQAPGRASQLDPDPTACFPTGWFLPGPYQGNETIINSMTTYTDACSDTYLVLVGDFSNLADPNDLPDEFFQAARVALYGRDKGDFNRDGFKDFFDYSDYVLCFEEPNNCPPGFDADFNCDGFIDFFDYSEYVFWFENA
jgi:hypothetical protein